MEYTNRNGKFHRFNVYKQPKRRQPFKNDHIKLETRLKEKNSRFDPPFSIYYWQDGERFFHRDKSVYELWRRFGEGYYNFYWIGGGQIKHFIKRTWIEKAV